MNAARLYLDVQQDAERDEAIAAFQLARVRYELDRLARQPEPAQFCAVVEEEPTARPQLREDFVIGVLGVAALVVLTIALTWGLPA